MRSWLIRATVSMAGLFVLCFLVIFVRGLFWSPNQVNDSQTTIDLGSTELVQQQRARLWLTRLSPNQRKRLEKIDQYVFTEGGCDAQLDKCLVQSKTSRQGVIIRYVEAKPDILKNDIPWIGGFINPVNSAIYDVLGRLYRDSKSDESTLKFIDFQQ